MKGRRHSVRQPRYFPSLKGLTQAALPRTRDRLVKLIYRSPRTIVRSKDNRVRFNLRAMALTLAVAGGLPSHTVWAQNTQPVSINIAAQSLNHALLQLGQQADIQIYYLPQTVAGFHAPALSGNYTPEQALGRRMRAGRSLRADVSACWATKISWIRHSTP